MTAPRTTGPRMISEVYVDRWGNDLWEVVVGARPGSALTLCVVDTRERAEAVKAEIERLALGEGAALKGGGR